jgi:hypothetical protein
LIIEYNGLRYHNSKYSDIMKFRALSVKHQYLMIYEDEWRLRRRCFEHLILNRLGKNNVRFKLRPSDCDIVLFNKQDVQDFYEKFHYQGYVNSTYNIGVVYNGKLIACMSIKRPTRQKSGDWEVSRMACNYEYRIHGIWSYLIKWIRYKGFVSGRIISFSDNRLMTGKVYAKMGFNKVGSVKPDYYWVKSDKRYHKSGLRKTGFEKESGLTEVQIRTSQGYHRVYDLGKTKWELIL